MTIQFLQVKDNIAYLFDSERGVVLRAPVEDYVGGIDEEVGPVVPQVTHRREVYKIVDSPASPGTLNPPSGKEGLAFDENQEIVVAPVPARDKRASIIPPHLRGMFVPNDAPGADIERRVV